MIRNYEITVYGRVQGVGFRYSAVNIASKYGIKGTVRNLPGGAVQLEIEGSESATNLMIEWCRQGPGTARVDRIDIFEGEAKGFDTFAVRY